MSQFTDVTVLKHANIYYDGKVTSRTVLFPDGTKKTLGIALPGEYEFSASLKEEMEILAGAAEYKLKGEDWKRIEGSGVFFVPANESFLFKVHTTVDYCCSYHKE
ncbi:pyrimidine/purine nucleoside phosphorylase [Paenibacillus thermotolerans]|uniref:pyrimidine/purine nucleoside phosphorylase n=1 Tax=Paenibacillus thermotolerans TaxID=3027807 RepID=UPI002367C00A|nr:MULTISPECIES: pyrimidine/purine nucleoside phosphorylase [unclassified Paenibacillus]